MKMGERSIRRVSSIVSASCSGFWAKPGATTVGTITGAATSMTAEKATSRIRSALSTLDATRQASSSRSRARYPAKTGMNADASAPATRSPKIARSEEHTSELQSRQYLVCRLLLEKKKKITITDTSLNQT